MASPTASRDPGTAPIHPSVRKRQNLSDLTSLAGLRRLSGRRSMARQQSRPNWVGPEYRIRVAFRVPLDFAFAWCTDYTPDDAKLEGESYRRKIIERTARRVVLEDLEETKPVGFGLGR